MRSSSFFPSPIRLRTAAVLVACVAAFLTLASSAGAACRYTGTEQVFSPWGDRHHYVLAPDGGFEAGASGWSLYSGAAVVGGNESHFLNDPADRASLSLPAGSTAVSPPVCMSLGTPIFRMVARNGGSPYSRLRVEASYRLLGLVRTRTLSTVTSGSEWAPTQQMSTVLTLSTIVGTLIPASIQIRITPLDRLGRWQVDDLYIDPFARR